MACHVIKVVKTNSTVNYLSEIFGFGSPSTFLNFNTPYGGLKILLLLKSLMSR